MVSPRSFDRIVSWVRTASVALLLACATPTLPLPPPMQPSVGAVSGGQVHLIGNAGSVAKSAVVVVINFDSAIPGDHRVGGAIADDTGAWDAWVYAQSGDVLEVTQQVGNETSPPVEVTVK